MNINYYTRSRTEMLEFLPINFTNVLEIGCGQGEFGKLVKKMYNINYTGIEINPLAAQEAKKYLDIVLVGDAYEQIQLLPDNSFDLLICNDVIEHFVAPEILLQNIRIKMKQNARIVCSIPNIRALGNLIHLLIDRDFEYTDYGIRDMTHLRFYTKKSIINFFDKNEFHIEKIMGINPIKSFKTGLLLGFLRIIGHGDTQYHQFGITAKF